MTLSDFALPIRPGEHACCRFDHPEDRERLALAFVRIGLQIGHKVVYLCAACDIHETALRLEASGRPVESAMQSGALQLRDAATISPTTDGGFDIERMLDAVRREHAGALAGGYTGLSLTGDVGAGVTGATAAERLAEYERRLDEELSGETRVLLCQYDHRRFDAGTLADATAAHQVDVSPELAALGRTGVLAAARVHPPETLRLAGELDFQSAEALGDVLDAHFHGPLRMDLQDLSFVDVTGLRILRGRKGQQLEIAAASEPVRRLVGLLGWDTDPAIQVAG